MLQAHRLGSDLWASRLSPSRLDHTHSAKTPLLFQGQEKEMSPAIAAEMPGTSQSVKRMLKWVASKVFSLISPPKYRLDAKVLHNDLAKSLPDFGYISLISPIINCNLYQLTIHLGGGTPSSTETVYQALEDSLKKHYPRASMQFSDGHRMICLYDRKEAIPINVFLKFSTKRFKDPYSFGGVK